METGGIQGPGSDRVRLALRLFMSAEETDYGVRRACPEAAGKQ